MSWRRLGVLVKHLPRESATGRRLLGAEATWGVPEHLLAAAVDALRDALWQNSGDKRLPRPERVPRPDDIERAAARRSQLSGKAMVARLREFQERARRRRR